jgi:predicted membrane GTPase involved in stress response
MENNYREGENNLQVNPGRCKMLANIRSSSTDEV